MRNDEPLITITQYSMTTARGIVLQSIPFWSVEHALNLHPLCSGTQSIVIKNNKANTGSVFNSDLTNAYQQIKQGLKELFPDAFGNT
ncbi:MAG: hypothetical protein QGF90_14510 [Gammaproteobacteria bacterium]|jgi:hypothetical protein|nr:hypothetical protein [Gammaproteobacteria bacterium]|tara:strand:+ start:117 stop:377 length:261 start_codon:yes stop_codon:yes gene_type:complete